MSDVIVNKYPQNKYPDLKDVKITEFKKRPIDDFKYYEVFGVELEEDNKPVSRRKRVFWAWRAYNFFCQLPPDEEILFTDFCSMYDSDEVEEFVIKVFKKKDDKNNRGA